MFIIEQKQSAREIAVNYLLEEIKNGSLIAGDKILNERKLSDKLGISRVPLREAICTLIFHRDIVHAIEQKDSKLAYRKMQEHILQIQTALDLDRIRRIDNENL